jgi:hypothetical protein
MDTLVDGIRVGGTFTPRPGDQVLWTTGSDGRSRWALLGHDCTERSAAVPSHDVRGRVLDRVMVCTPVQEPVRSGYVGSDGLLYDEGYAPSRL